MAAIPTQQLPLQPVLNANGDDIAPIVCDVAEQTGVDPVHLLALMKAESNLNPYAERWGIYTADARSAIESVDFALLESIIATAWPDISFGYSQRIVLYHDTGDRSASVENCLLVRDYVFSHQEEDIMAAATRLRGCFSNPTCDGSIISALVVYNAGSDRRNDPVWAARWRGNVASYERALAFADAFRR